MSTPDRPDPERLHLLNVGLTLHASVVVSAVLYLLLGSSGPPEARPTLTLLTVGAAGMFVLIAALPRRLVTRDAVWHPFLIAWDGLCVVAIAVAVIIDGADSTIGLLLNVPMVFVGLAFPRRAAIGVCAIDIVGTLLAYSAAPGASPARTALATCVVAITAGFCLYQVARQERIKRQLAAISRTDPLTDVLNRRGFEAALADAIAAHAAGLLAGFTLVSVDLDDFKAINDSAGHAAGDAVLRRVAGALCGTLRGGDQVGRLGGDEFAALLLGEPGTPEGPADRIAAALEHDGIEASLGFAHFPTDAHDADALQRVADAGMYAAKRGGVAT